MVLITRIYLFFHARLMKHVTIQDPVSAVSSRFTFGQCQLPSVQKCPKYTVALR